LRAARHPDVCYAASAFRKSGLASDASRAQSWQSHTLTRGASDQKNAPTLRASSTAAHPLQGGDELFAGVEVTSRPRTAVDTLALSARLFGLRFCRHVYHGEKGF
jgi:hypothetical protein